MLRKLSTLGLGFGLHLVFTGQALAAACCGGGAGIPALITTDDHAQLAVSASQSAVIGDAGARGEIPVFRADGDQDLTRTLGLSGAWSLAPEWQLGAESRVLQRDLDRGTARQTRSAYTLGDSRIVLGYEFLPELSFSRWKPRGFAWLALGVPSGTSPDRVDPDLATGTGNWSAALGLVFLKRGSVWDGVLSAEWEVPWPRDAEDGVHRTGSSVRVALGGGWSPGAAPYRVGLRVSPQYRFAGNVDFRGGAAATTIESQLLWETAIETSYLLTPQTSLSLVLRDQTVAGPAWNATLSRALVLSFQQRWE